MHKILYVITRLTVGGDTNVVLDSAEHFGSHPDFRAHLAVGPVPASELDLTHLAAERGIPTTVVRTMINRANPLLNLRAVAALRAVIRRGRYDIVHTHSSVAGVLGRLAAATAGVQTIFHHVHGWGLQEGMSPALRAAYLAAERLCARFTTRLIAVSARTAQKGIELRIAPPGKFVVIYNGLDVNRFDVAVDVQQVRAQEGIDGEGPVVGMIGRLDPQKNPQDFIRAAARVVAARPDARFLFLGEGALRSECEALVEELGVKGRVLLPGFRPDVPRILPALSVVVSTSLWEGLPVAFQEAMCAGRPIVANDVDGVSEVVVHGETGYLVPAHDHAALAARVLELLENEPLRQRMGERARLASRRFSRDAMLRQFEALYAEAGSRPLAAPVAAQRSRPSHGTASRV